MQRLCADRLRFFFSSRRRHTRSLCDWSSDLCSSDLDAASLKVEKGLNGLKATFTVSSGTTQSTTVSPTQARGTLLELGRASCRERAKLWVAAASVRHKKCTPSTHPDR